MFEIPIAIYSELHENLKENQYLKIQYTVNEDEPDEI
jgi:hypothetical protein